jgi:hypothetical protein
MKTFSERYGYVKVDDALIREQINIPIRNAIYNCCLYLQNKVGRDTLNSFTWVYFLNNRNDTYNDFGHKCVFTFILVEKSWFRILDLIEFILEVLINNNEKDNSSLFSNDLNSEFERLNYAYRIVDGKVLEITNDEEIKSITKAIDNNKDNIKMHLLSALSLVSKKPNGDYRNSIKESISAVEAYCREITDENTLGPALNKLSKRDVIIPKVLLDAFTKLYGYTCCKETGIRHALMDEDGNYTPTYSEALFMLISCSAFINYLNQKI